MEQEPTEKTEPGNFSLRSLCFLLLIFPVTAFADAPDWENEQILHINTEPPRATFVPFAVQGGQVFINQAFIQDASISMAKITTVLQSDNYVAGQTGWAITRAGNVEFNSTVSGGGRLTMNNRAIKVFDANGVLRVQLGDLSA